MGNIEQPTYKLYDGRPLVDATITLKIDGVQAVASSVGVISRKGKPLYNVVLPEGVLKAEVFVDDWETSVGLVRTKASKVVPPTAVYSLWPTIDPRLVVGSFPIVDAELVRVVYDAAIKAGYEGLVVHTKDCLYKVKPKETYDVEVLSVIEGKGKHVGKLGAVLTSKGKVGTGFTDAERERWLHTIVGETIEVECMSLTTNGMFRHPRFIRVRFDK